MFKYWNQTGKEILDDWTCCKSEALNHFPSHTHNSNNHLYQLTSVFRSYLISRFKYFAEKTKESWHVTSWTRSMKHSSQAANRETCKCNSSHATNPLLVGLHTSQFLYHEQTVLSIINSYVANIQWLMTQNQAKNLQILCFVLIILLE